MATVNVDDSRPRPRPMHWAPEVLVAPLCGVRLWRWVRVTTDPHAVTCRKCTGAVVGLGRSLSLAFPYRPIAPEDGR